MGIGDSINYNRLWIYQIHTWAGKFFQQQQQQQPQGSLYDLLALRPQEKREKKRTGARQTLSSSCPQDNWLSWCVHVCSLSLASRKRSLSYSISGPGWSHPPKKAEKKGRRARGRRRGSCLPPGGSFVRRRSGREEGDSVGGGRRP